jgi:probable HAF family extracellular repeat protein
MSPYLSLCLGLLLSAVTPAQDLSFTFTTIDVPGGLPGSTAWGINDAGQIVGSFTDSTGGGHGFVYTDGSFAIIDVPGAFFTTLAGINNAGQFVGRFGDSTGNHGFVHTDGSFTVIDVPGAGFTVPTGINGSGQIVGYFIDSLQREHGFLYADGRFTQLDVPGAFLTVAYGINNAGQIVGTFGKDGGGHGFVYTDGSFTIIDVPGAFSTPAEGINDAGQVVGEFFDSGGDHGFLYTGGRFIPIDVPGAASVTHALGINSAGQIVGFFEDSVRINHGFLADPVKPLDTVPPTTIADAIPSANVSGWNNTLVTVNLTATDDAGGSGIKEISYTLSGATNQSATIQSDAGSIVIAAQGVTTVTYLAIDKAGNAEQAHALTLRIDHTPPTIVGFRLPNPNVSDWNHSAVTISFQCSDTLSGLAAGSPPAPTIVSTQAAGQSVKGTCADLAGNSEYLTVADINIDLTMPTVTPPPNQVVQQASQSGALVNYPAATTVDALSGIASVSCVPATGSVFPVGLTIVTCTAMDRAGNTGSATFSVTVTPAPDGRMFGIGFISQNGLHQHFVLRVTQARNRDSGRLEYWVSDPRRCGFDDGCDHDQNVNGDHDRDLGRDHHSPPNHFEATSIDAVFSDDGAFLPGHGPGPTVDTVRFGGTGTWNGRSGYTFEGLATDQGEPGRHRDAFSLMVKDAQGNIVESVSGSLEGGNIQSTRLGR